MAALDVLVGCLQAQMGTPRTTTTTTIPAGGESKGAGEGGDGGEGGEGAALSGFSPILWERVFREILFPIFDDVRSSSSSSSSSSAEGGKEESEGKTGTGTVAVALKAGTGAPEFPPPRRPGTPEEVAAWVDTTFTRALTALVSLYAEGYGVLGHLLGDMLQVGREGRGDVLWRV